MNMGQNFSNAGGSFSFFFFSSFTSPLYYFFHVGVLIAFFVSSQAYASISVCSSVLSYRFAVFPTPPSIVFQTCLFALLYFLFRIFSCSCYCSCPFFFFFFTPLMLRF